LKNLIDKFQFANLPFEREKNPITKGFYEHIGFYPIGTHRFFMGRDNRTDYLIRKDLQSPVLEK